jgi:hypothetical protein
LPLPFAFTPFDFETNSFFSGALSLSLMSMSVASLPRNFSNVQATRLSAAHVDLSSAFDLVAVLSTDGSVTIHRTFSWEEVASYSVTDFDHSGQFIGTRLCFGPSGNLLAVASNGAEGAGMPAVALLSIEDGEIWHAKPLATLCQSPPSAAAILVSLQWLPTPGFTSFPPSVAPLATEGLFEYNDSAFDAELTAARTPGTMGAGGSTSASESPGLSFVGSAFPSLFCAGGEDDLGIAPVGSGRTPLCIQPAAEAEAVASGASALLVAGDAAGGLTFFAYGLLPLCRIEGNAWAGGLIGGPGSPFPSFPSSSPTTSSSPATSSSSFSTTTTTTTTATSTSTSTPVLYTPFVGPTAEHGSLTLAAMFTTRTATNSNPTEIANLPRSSGNDRESQRSEESEKERQRQQQQQHSVPVDDAFDGQLHLLSTQPRLLVDYPLVARISALLLQVAIASFSCSFSCSFNWLACAFRFSLFAFLFSTCWHAILTFLVHQIFSFVTSQTRNKTQKKNLIVLSNQLRKLPIAKSKFASSDVLPYCNPQLSSDLVSSLDVVGALAKRWREATRALPMKLGLLQSALGTAFKYERCTQASFSFYSFYSFYSLFSLFSLFVCLFVSLFLFFLCASIFFSRQMTSK